MLAVKLVCLSTLHYDFVIELLLVIISAVLNTACVRVFVAVKFLKHISTAYIAIVLYMHMFVYENKRG